MIKNRILLCATKLARTHGVHAITRDGVASYARCGQGTVNYHFGTARQLRRAVLNAAIEAEDIEILARALPDKDGDLVGRLTPALLLRVSNHITGR